MRAKPVTFCSLALFFASFHFYIGTLVVHFITYTFSATHSFSTDGSYHKGIQYSILYLLNLCFSGMCWADYNMYI